MILYGFLALIGLSMAVGILRWRWGLLLLLLVGALQDPVRKMVPGVPGYLMLSTLPVWTSIMIGAFRSGDFSWRRFKEIYPRLSPVTVFFVCALIPAALMSLTYAPGSWQITVLGIYAYFSAFSGIMMGVFYPERDGDIERVMLCYVGVVAVMLIGAPMEHLGIGLSSGAVGTHRLGNIWVTYRTGAVVRMMAGFYRSPDIMGWHAACMVMLSFILALRFTDWRRFLFMGVAGWGGVGVMLCARRKMISGLVVFLIIFLVLFVRHRQARRIMTLVLVALCAFVVWAYAYEQSGTSTEVEGFYSTIVSEAGERFHKHAVQASRGTIKQAGFFGYGLGMAVQGAHHIKVKRPNIWQEGGLPKLLAEVGVPGALALLVLLIALSRSGGEVLYWVADFPHAVLYFGLAALLLSNVISAIISAQVYGDPFIGVLLPFLSGVFLSGTRLKIAEETEDE